MIRQLSAQYLTVGDRLQPHRRALERVAFGLSPFGSFSAAGSTFSLVDPIWVFLARRRFAAKTPDYKGWISLDFLGFSRPNLDFSMGYADKS